LHSPADSGSDFGSGGGVAHEGCGCRGGRPPPVDSPEGSTEGSRGDCSGGFLGAYRRAFRRCEVSDWQRAGPTMTATTTT
jgi:hypothetical protein